MAEDIDNLPPLFTLDDLSVELAGGMRMRDPEDAESGVGSDTPEGYEGEGCEDVDERRLLPHLRTRTRA